jgi:uncharacterized protein (TIGR02391 family)
MDFMRGKFDDAVFHAMKAVEVTVREASGLPSDLTGVRLMRKAFEPKTGPLADPNAEAGEQQAQCELFAGAIGSFRNSQAHRYVNLDNPTEALEIVMLANYLLSTVEGRRSPNASASSSNAAPTQP